FVVFSGGTACNHILEAFHNVSDKVNYVLGISDNGGSTSELLRVLGGPSVGDLRSRLLKLMDLFDTGDQEMVAIKHLLSYRLPVHPHVYEEWLLILNGSHKLWKDISIEKKETIRQFLRLFDLEIQNKQFNFSHGSIGNFLLTGARLFTGSLETSLFLFASIIKVPGLVTAVIDSSQPTTITATLTNGATLVGQCEISHPTTPTEECSFLFSKRINPQLDSPIHRIYYTNPWQQEIFPTPNPKVLSHISTHRHLVYSIGSLYTSLVPCLILRSIGNAIAHSTSLKHKILMLNGSTDRETHGYSALDFVLAITRALNESQRIDSRCPSHLLDLNTPPASPTTHDMFYPSPASAFITHLIYLDNTTIPVDLPAIRKLGIQCIPVHGEFSTDGEPIYRPQVLTKAIQENFIFSN
ncbi:hypothetical protein CU098_001611, partial [Rhizopus stolonifer]